MDTDAGRAKRRVDRSARSVDAGRIRIKRWLAERQSGKDFARFSNHFSVLDQVVSAMLDAICGQLDVVERERSGSVLVYERCRELDESLAITTRLFDWYAAKYDQRRDEDLAAPLHAADEVVRSCWSEPFERAGRQPPTGPLAYIDDRFDAFATLRHSVPSDLRAPEDAVVAEFLSELPIPAIALPDYAVREPWWLALAAHETGHHVQMDLAPDLEQITRDRIASALADLADSGSLADPELPSMWDGWSLEAFADAYSAAMIGAAAGWVLDELQHASPATMLKPAAPGSRYPAPVVRLALFETCRYELGQTPTRPAGLAVPGSQAIRIQLTTVPAVASALAELPVGAPHLRDLAKVEYGLLTEPAPLRAWADQLACPSPALPALADRASARLVIAAGVAAYQKWAHQRAAVNVLPVIHDNLLRLLPTCGPAGVLAAAPAEAEVTALAERLARRLVTPGEAGR